MHASIAAKVRADKAVHPERYCPDPRCLWRSTSKPCPKHPVKHVPRCDDPGAHHPNCRCDGGEPIL